MDTSQYLDVFIDESNEHLEVLYKQILALEKSPKEKPIIEEIFRAAHTLKGMSATMGYQDLADLTHKLENVFDEIRYDRITVQTEMIDVLFDTVDHLNEMVEDIASGGTGKKDISLIVDILQQIEHGDILNVQEDSESPIIDTSETEDMLVTINEFELSILNESKEQGFANYRIKVRVREDCVLKGARVFMVFEVLEALGEVIKSDPPVTELEEENFDDTFTVLLVTKSKKQEIEEKIKKVSEIDDVHITDFAIPASIIDPNDEIEKKEEQVDPPVAPVLEEKNDEKTKGKVVTKAQPNKTIRVNIERLDVLMNLFEELVIDRGRLEQISQELNHQDLQDTVERMTRVSGDLQNIILTMRMVPIEQVFSRFPRMVRKLSRDLHKQVEMVIMGAETELDRTVIDEIGDPLVHLIRNAMDHGIEMPAIREKQGKPAKGTIKLNAYHSGNHVFIEITDDGAGINKEKVLHKAIENGVIDQSQVDTLNDQQVYELIMASGFSTADKISDLSGRGVGLDVVKNTIESLGGHITIDSEFGSGSVFSIQLPLTLSIISALLVDLQHEKYAIPLSSIMETTVIHKDQVMHAHNKDVIDFRGKIVPLVNMNQTFHIPNDIEEDSDYVSIVIVRKGEKLAGLVVNSFIGQQEIVLKSLGNYLGNVFAISGATILGNGQVALIIDCNALIK